MKDHQLGQGLTVSAVGLGCMGMSQSRGPRDDDESLAVIARSLDLGITFIDTADVYGPFTNEQLVGKAIARHRDEVVLATKFGNVKHPDGTRGFDGSPKHVHEACDGSLQRLGVDHIDLYYQHRVDPAVPVEETFGALGELVEEGKVRFLGISEAAAATVRRAHAVHPLSAVQNEYSLFTRDPEDELFATIRELGISLVAYSPLGRGFLTGAITTPEQFAPEDGRARNPRFMGDNFAKNLAVVQRVGELAADKGITTSQLALAWVLAQGNDVVALPGSRTRTHLDENAEAADIELSATDLASIEDVAPKGVASGARYPEAEMANLNG